jgi:hypothetical protein
MRVTLVHDVLTVAEKSLARSGQADAVSHVRQLIQSVMEANFPETVDRFTGRRVPAFISGKSHRFRRRRRGVHPRRAAAERCGPRIGPDNALEGAGPLGSGLGKYG